MRIYQLTPVGNSMAANPTNNITPGMKILYFLRRHGGRATDEQIIAYTGLAREQLYASMASLTRGTSPMVRVLS